MYIYGKVLFILKSYFFTFYPTLFYKTFVVDGIVLYYEQNEGWKRSLTNNGTRGMDPFFK